MCAFFLAHTLQVRRQLAQVLARLPERFFGAHALGDVAQHHGVELLVAILALRNGRLDRELATIGAQRIQHARAAHAPVGPARRTEMLDVLRMRDAKPFGDEARERTAYDLRRIAAEQFLRHRVHQDDALQCVDRHDCFARRADDGCQARFVEGLHRCCAVQVVLVRLCAGEAIAPLLAMRPHDARNQDREHGCACDGRRPSQRETGCKRGREHARHEGGEHRQCRAKALTGWRGNSIHVVVQIVGLRRGAPGFLLPRRFCAPVRAMAAYVSDAAL